jgi:hypothetical protein
MKHLLSGFRSVIQVFINRMKAERKDEKGVIKR